MTVDIATLGIRIDSREALTAAQSLERMRDSGARAEQQAASLDVVTRKLSQALQLLGVGAGVGAIIRMADEYTKFNAQIKLATQSQREYAAAVDDVRRIANAAQQDLAATGTLYARITNGTRELGVQQKQVAAITETVNLALKVSGATAAESASAQLQLSQAFASGALRGEEFNAVNEAAPRLMKALADGLGVPIGALKKMAEEGLLTTRVMSEVLPKSLDPLKEESKQIQTIAGAFTVLKNNVMEFTGTQAQASGAVSVLTGGIMLLAGNLDVLLGVVGTLAAAKLATSLSAWATGAYQSAAANRTLALSNLAAADANVAASAAALATARAREAELRASVLAAEGVVALAITENGLIPAQARSAAAAQAHTAALAAQTAAASAASVGMGVLRGALAFLGGPIGAVVTVLGVAATAWSWYSSRSTEANTKTTDETKASTAEVVAQMTKQIEVMERRNKMALAGAPTTGKQNTLDDKLSDIVAQMDQVAKAEGDYAKLSYEARGEVLKVLGSQYGDVTALIERFNKASADGAGNTAAAKALVDIRERLTGVSGQYQKDLKTYQTALAEGVISIAEYTAGLSALAVETWKGSEAGKAATSAVNKSVEAYKTLISSIRETTATNKLELAAGIDASDAQKARIKLDQELASGKVKLAAGQLASVRAALAEQDASEKALKSQRSVAAAVAELTEQRRQDFEAAAAEAAASQQAVVTFGLTKAQIELLTVARLKDRIAHAADLQLTSDDIAQTERLIAVKQKSADALTKSDALSYIKQLSEENKRFAADSIIDERARAAALLEIDAEVWRKRIALAGEGTEAQRAMQEQYQTWYQNQQQKPAIDEWRASVKKYDDVFRTGFADMLNHGKSGWKSFTTSLLTTFKTTVADQIYKMLAQPFVVSMVGNLMGVTGSGAAGVVANGAASAAGSSLGLGTGLGGTIGAIGNGAMQTAGAVMSGQIGLFDTIAAGWSAATSGTMAGFTAGMSSLAGTLGPIALGVAAVTSLVKKWDTSGTIHTGGAASASAAGVSNIDAKTLGFQRINVAEATNTLTAQLATSIVGILDSTAKTFGKTAGYTVSTGFADDSSRDGAWGALSIHNGNGLVSAWGDANSRWAPKVFSDGEAGQKEYLADISKSVRSALDGIGMPEWATSMLSSLGSAPALEDLAKVVDTINATQKALALMGDRLTGFAGLSDAAVSALIKASGGMEGLAANASAYYDSFYSEGEKTAVVTKQVADALKAVGVEMPATREGYRAEVEARLKLGAAGADAVAALLANASAYAQVVPAIEAVTAATRSLADIESERVDLQNQLDQLTMTQEQLAAKARSAIDGHNLALYDQVQAAQAAKDATETAAAAAAALASTNANYQQQIDQLLAAREGEAAVRALGIAGMSASTVALYDRLKALQAEDKATAAATEAIKKAQDAAAETARQAQQQYAEQVRDWQATVDSARNALSQAYERESSALESAISKAREFAQAMRSFSDSLKIGDLSTLSPEAKYAEAQRQFANATPEQLQGASTALLEASKAYNSNSEAYARDYAAVQEAISQAAVAADSQVVAAQQQLNYLALQVSGIAEVNKSVLSVVDALAAYKAAVAAPIVPAQNYGAGTVAPGYLPGTTAGWTNIDWNYIRKQAVDGSHENGLWSVPRNGYIAELHEEEAVLTRPQAQQWRAGQIGASASGGTEIAALLREVVAENREMRAELAEVKGQLQAANTQRGAIAQAQLRQGDAVAQKLDKTARKLETI
ncbi:tape measure protein [Duganella sp. FT94W]|uniref:Tape measure protein n=1 Tax=Duganella lactea TaxID=2692173 RepID=A0ABW9V856_9BURK|nr:tape measure protein [Duganella lactea]MYM34942.1 tape measure protein [Duganella lactea]